MTEVTSMRAAPPTGDTAVWPPAEYAAQVKRLRGAIGQPVYLVEITFSGLAAAATFHDQPRILLDVVEFARPDPGRGLYPHLLVFDDGRGINLGRVARVSLRSVYNPGTGDVLYSDRRAQQSLLYGPRRLSPRRIAAIVRHQLAMLLGAPLRPALERATRKLRGKPDKQ